MVIRSRRVPVMLGLSSNEAPSPAQSVERLVNAYLEVTPNGKEPAPVYGTPGVTLFATVDDNIRGMLEVAGLLYVVAGDNLLLVDAGGTPSELYSAMTPEIGGVKMASDGITVVTANAGDIWVWNIDAAAMTHVTDPDVLLTDTTAYLDGFYVFAKQDSGEFFISDLQDPTSYDPLNFASAEWRPDKLILPLVRGRTLLLMGAKSIEGWQNVGAVDFPFSRLNDLLIDVGVAGRDAAVSTNETVYWLASDGTVRRLDGATATRISTYPMERIIAGWDQPEATIVSAHVWLGHLFVVIRNGEGCIVYDQSTERWHERDSQSVGTWAYLYNADCYGKRLYSRENKIYALDAASASDIETSIILEMVTPFVSAQGKRFSVNELELVMQTGDGDADSGEVSVEATNDGITWKTARTKTYTAPASTTVRLRFGRYGQSRAIAFRVTITGIAKRAILGLYADVEVDQS